MDLLRYTAPTRGDLVLSCLKDEINFQDLQSTIRFFERYFVIKLVLTDEQRDGIIRAHALRNIVVHNNGIADSGFLKQLRDTRYRTDYQPGNQVIISHEDYEEIANLFKLFSAQIIESINGRLSVGDAVLRS